jgi:hypothetical protein
MPSGADPLALGTLNPSETRAGKPRAGPRGSSSTSPLVGSWFVLSSASTTTTPPLLDRILFESSQGTGPSPIVPPDGGRPQGVRVPRNCRPGGRSVASGAPSPPRAWGRGGVRAASAPPQSFAPGPRGRSDPATRRHSGGDGGTHTRRRPILSQGARGSVCAAPSSRPGPGSHCLRDVKEPATHRVLKSLSVRT